jgi:hypothetical protein
MQASFNSVPYDSGIYMPSMSDHFGSVDFGMPEMMFRDGLREGAFGEASDMNNMFMMDIDTILSVKAFDSSNNDDYTSVGHF